MAPEHDENGWPEYKRLVIGEMERHEVWLKSIDNKLQALHTDFTKEISVIKTRSTMLGLIAGSIPAIIAIILVLLKGG